MEALRVLVVEDEMLIGMLLGDTLGAMGYDVCAVEATETGAVGGRGRSLEPGYDDCRRAAARWKRRHGRRGNTPHWVDSARFRQWRDFDDTGTETRRNYGPKALS
jgi:CheY-like chemotaxis protein